MTEALAWLVALWSILGFFYGVIKVFMDDDLVRQELYMAEKWRDNYKQALEKYMGKDE